MKKKIFGLMTAGSRMIPLNFFRLHAFKSFAPI